MKNFQNQRLSLCSVKKDFLIVCLTMVRPIEDNPDSEISESFASKMSNHGHWNPEFR